MRFIPVGQFLRRLSRHRSIRLTPEGTRFLLLTLGVGAAAINTGHNLLYLFFAMMLSLILISGILSEQCFRQLDIRRLLPAHLFANRPATASIVITNRKAHLSTFSLQVMDIVSEKPVDCGIHLLHLAPGATLRRSYSLLVPRRGRYRLDGVKLVTRFPFGLFAKAATLPLPGEVLVYPQIRALPGALLHQLTAYGQGEPILQRGQGTGLHNIRLYQPGDDSRTIHWKTTARKTQLMVRETEAENQQRVTLALHTGLPDHTADKTGSRSFEDRFEEAVILTASLAHFFRQRDYQIRLLVGGDDVPFGIGEAHFSRLLTLLALCEPTGVPSSGAIQALGDLSGSSEYSIVVLPLSEPRIMDVCRGVSRFLIASDVT
ncbi:MAG: DUF58 domain-containing protein [Nitrospiraceae bacterium]